MLKKLINLKSKKGFTLIELIVVIAILAILAAILVPSMLGILSDSKQKVADTNARAVYSAAVTAYSFLNTTDTAVTGGPFVSSDAEDAATDFMIKVAANLGGNFTGVYTITLDADGVAGTTYVDPNGKTGNYPAAAA